MMKIKFVVIVLNWMRYFYMNLPEIRTMNSDEFNISHVDLEKKFDTTSSCYFNISYF